MGFGINNTDHGVVCNTGLGLGLISSHENKLERSSSSCCDDQIKKKKVCLKLKYNDDMFPSLTLGLAAPQEVSSASAVTNNNSIISVKKEKELILEERSNISDHDNEEEGEGEEELEGSPRKKLRLTKQQSALLEDNFKQHTTLNPKQKQALAQQLNLRPRQVEVWFQNRRARTKLKQTEVDCEVLKKCCETLTEENKRLQKELQDLKSSAPPQLYMHLPPPTLSLCPSCDRISGAGAGDGSSTSILTVVGRPPKPHFFSPYTHPSAAC